MTSKVCESGVTVSVTEQHDNPKNCQIFFNPRMKISRELALTALCVLDKQSQKPGALKCLDAFAGTGIAGMQWKRTLGSKVEVTINDLDAQAVDGIRKNCATNHLKEGRTSHSYPTQGSMLPGDKSAAGAGERLEFADRDAPAATDVVEVTHNDADVILHQRQFNFIYIDAFGSPVLHLASAFRHAFHGAVVVLVATDIAALYGKAPDVLRRNYAADASRTDYTREMAARILLAAAAQSAARCNKGIRVLYAASDAHFVSVAVQVWRGAKHANVSANMTASTLHCMLCHEWEVVDRSSSPHENMYKVLPCSCYSDNPGKTAIQLGPMWTGPIFDRDYIQHMVHFARDLKFSQYTQNLFSTLLEEAECPLIACKDSVFGDLTVSKHSNSGPVGGKSLSNALVSNSEDQSNGKVAQSSDGREDLGQSTGHGNKMDQSTGENLDQCASKLGQSTVKVDQSAKGKLDTEQKSEKSNKRQSDESVSTEAKRAKTNNEVTKLDISLSKGYRNCERSVVPMFYHNLHKRKLQNIDIPKIGKVVSLLHREGYRASRTHFESMAVRTDASHAQMKAVLAKHCSQHDQ